MLFSIPADHPSLPGHFPGRPVVPGVVVLDKVMQALAQRGIAPPAWRLAHVKFLHPLLPEQQAEIVLEGEGQWRFQEHCAGRTIASGLIETADRCE